MSKHSGIAAVRNQFYGKKQTNDSFEMPELFFIYTNPEDRCQKFVDAWCDVKGGGGG